jgi:hypothetical protein
MRLTKPVAAALFALACTVLAGCGSAHPAALPLHTIAPVRTIAPAPDSKPAGKPAIRHYVGIIASQMPHSYAPAESFQAATGAKVGIVAYYSSWPEGFQSQFAETAWEHGSTTMVDIDPPDGENAMTQIADGKYDWYLNDFAQTVRDFGHKVIINFGHEVNGSWFAYGYKHVQPATFVAAFRHVHNVFAAAGARNVTWMWDVNVPVGSQTGPIAQFYPGDAYVNWVGIDGYDWQAKRTFSEVFGSMITQVRQITSRPILIAETSVLPGPNAVMQVTSWLHGIEADNLLGLVWFDVNKTHAQHTTDTHDWKLEDDPPALAAFRAAIPAYLGTSSYP